MRQPELIHSSRLLHHDVMWCQKANIFPIQSRAYLSKKLCVRERISIFDCVSLKYFPTLHDEDDDEHGNRGVIIQSHNHLCEPPHIHTQVNQSMGFVSGSALFILH